ncbi:hypothetical protein BGZ46_007600 [Entomortierella lignicola]|nr:hypothetical protein BGZ46_007600 [Entomortierella lignicola]
MVEVSVVDSDMQQVDTVEGFVVDSDIVEDKTAKSVVAVDFDKTAEAQLADTVVVAAAGDAGVGLVLKSQNDFEQSCIRQRLGPWSHKARLDLG